MPLEMGDPVLAQPEPRTDLSLRQPTALARRAQQQAELGRSEQRVGGRRRLELSEIQMIRFYL